MCVPRGLREPIVETAAAGARDVRENAVQRGFALFVGIEPFIEEIAQETPVLRNPLAVDAGRGDDRIRAVLGIGGKVADRREAEARNHRIGHDIHVFVDATGLKPAIQMNMPIAGSEFPVDGFGELPLRCRNENALGIPRVANGQHVAGITHVGDRILEAAYSAGDQMPERNLLRHARKHHVAPE